MASPGSRRRLETEIVWCGERLSSGELSEDEMVLVAETSEALQGAVGNPVNLESIDFHTHPDIRESVGISERVLELFAFR